LRSDPLADCRIYARGYLAGSYAAELDEFVVCQREALVLVALRELGVSPQAAKEILEQARFDAHSMIPDMLELSGRLVAANMIITILQQRVAKLSLESDKAA